MNELEAAKKRIAELERQFTVAIESLVDIRRHQEIVSGPLAKLSATWRMADKAIRQIEQPEPESRIVRSTKGRRRANSEF